MVCAWYKTNMSVIHRYVFSTHSFLLSEIYINLIKYASLISHYKISETYINSNNKKELKREC